MASVKLSAYGTAVSVLTTELNSLANGSVCGVSGSGSGTIFDNTSNLNLYADFILNVVFGVAPTAGSVCSLYYVASLDGTNYETSVAAGTTAPNSAKLVGTFTLETAGTTQAIVGPVRWPLLPGKIKFQLVNSAGQAFPATGSTVNLYPYALTVA